MLLTPAHAWQIDRWPFQEASWMSSRAKKLNTHMEVWGSSNTPTTTICHANPPAQASDSMPAAHDNAGQLLPSSRHREMKRHDLQMLRCFDEIDTPDLQDSLPSYARMLDCGNAQLPATQNMASGNKQYACGQRLPSGSGPSETRATPGSWFGPSRGSSAATASHVLGSLSASDSNAKFQRAGETVLSDNLRDRQLLSLVAYMRECSATEETASSKLADVGFSTCDMSWLVTGHRTLREAQCEAAAGPALRVNPPAMSRPGLPQ